MPTPPPGQATTRLAGHPHRRRASPPGPTPPAGSAPPTPSTPSEPPSSPAPAPAPAPAPRSPGTSAATAAPATSSTSRARTVIPDGPHSAARVPPRTPRRRPTGPPTDTNARHGVARRPRPPPPHRPPPADRHPRDRPPRVARPAGTTIRGSAATPTCPRSERGAGHPLGRSRVWPSPPGDTHTHLFGGSRSKSGTVPQPWVATSGRGESEYPTGASGSTTPSRNAGRSPSDRGSRWFGQQSRTAQEGTDVHPHHRPGRPAAPCRHPARGRRPRRRPGDQRVRRPHREPHREPHRGGGPSASASASPSPSATADRRAHPDHSPSATTTPSPTEPGPVAERQRLADGPPRPAARAHDVPQGRFGRRSSPAASGATPQTAYAADFIARTLADGDDHYVYPDYGGFPDGREHDRRDPRPGRRPAPARPRRTPRSPTSRTT